MTCAFRPSLGERYVLRVPKNIDEGIRDSYTESVAVPIARAAGLKTPDLLMFDDSRTILDVPFTIYERVAGQNFLLTDHDVPSAAAVYRELGRQLALLHERVLDCADPKGYLDEPGVAPPRPLVEGLAAAGKVSTRNVRWLERVLARLEPAVAGAAGLRRFVHQDAHPGNIIVRDGVYAAIIDWNDAGWGDPAIEFANVPAPAVPYALAGYREAIPLTATRLPKPACCGITSQTPCAGFVRTPGGTYPAGGRQLRS